MKDYEEERIVKMDGVEISVGQEYYSSDLHKEHLEQYNCEVALSTKDKLQERGAVAPHETTFDLSTKEYQDIQQEIFRDSQYLKNIYNGRAVVTAVNDKYVSLNEKTGGGEMKTSEFVARIKRGEYKLCEPQPMKDRLKTACAAASEANRSHKTQTKLTTISR